jgi:hypothetical protein
VQRAVKACTVGEVECGRGCGDTTGKTGDVLYYNL